MFMTLSIDLQVICIKVFNNSLFWPEDVSLMMMIWVAFATAPIAYRMGTNVSLDPVIRMLKGRLPHLLQLLIHMLIMLMVVLLIIEAVNLIGRTKIRANSIPLSMKYVYMIMPIGLGAMVVVGVELVLRSFIGIINPDDDYIRVKVPVVAQAAESL
jgi:TRAP-type C4-dicarboxylate transport system permease small subunit